MTALALSVFVAALLGSVHCAGMCGSFACLASGGDASHGRAALGSTVAYNLGRLLSYTTLGTIAGAAGAGLDELGAVAGVARPAAVAAGVLLILWGLASLLATFGVRLPALAVPPALAARVARGVRAVQERPPAVRGVALGVLTAALPCGWLYAFVATSELAIPVYPTVERQRNTEGLVTVEVALDEEGKVVSAKAVSGPRGLRQPAEDAVRKSRFNPVKVGDAAVKATGFINFNFKLN